MADEKIIGGVYFPTPEKMNKKVAANREAELQKELLKVRDQMEAATTYSISVRNLSFSARQALEELGYEITTVTDQWKTVLHYDISW